MVKRSVLYLPAIISFLFVSRGSQAQGVLPVHRYHVESLSALTWDATANNSVINNGSGTWNSGSPRWVAAPPAGANNAWLPGSSAIFGGNPGVGSAGTVNVSGTRTVKSITFNPTPSGNFTLSGSGTLSLLGGLFNINQNATITTKLTGSQNYIKRGAATLTLEGNNSLTGVVLTISQGNIWLNNNNAGGNASFVMGDGNTGSNNIGWFFGGSQTPNNNITVANYGTGIITLGSFSSGLNTEHSGNIALNKDVTFFDGTDDRTTFTGVISGAGNINIDGTGTWNSATGMTARITFDNNGNSFTGSITINPNKAFQLNNTDVINNQPVINNGFLVMNAGTTGTIGTLTGNGVCEIHPLVGSQALSIGNDGGSGSFSGTIRNGSGAGILSLIKAGSGTANLSGTHTYTGSTTVNAGILNFGSAASVPSSATWNLVVSNVAPGITNSGKIVLKNAPALAGKTVNIVITESGTGISFQVASWTGTATGTPLLRVNGAARTFGVATAGTTVTYSTTAGIIVSR